MMDHWRTLVEHGKETLGLFVLATGMPVVTRLTEMVVGAIIIAVGTSTLTANVVVAKLDERISGMATRVSACEQGLRDINMEVRGHESDDKAVLQRLTMCEALVNRDRGEQYPRARR